MTAKEHYERYRFFHDITERPCWFIVNIMRVW